MRKVLILALLLSAVLTLSVAPVGVQAQEKANWTILHYTDVDNDLETAAFNDYYEMQIAGSGDGINIVAQLDRAEGFESRFGDWTDTRRFLIEQVPALPTLDTAGQRAALVDYFVALGYGSVDEVEPQVDSLDDATIKSIYENNNVGVAFDQIAVEELGEVDMGDPQSLVDFIEWGVENYPAEHYMIVIGSHGGGWRGIGPDEGNNAESMLELPEIDAALAQARANLGIEKFDIVGFDACLMGVTDVAVMLEAHADYVLFSQEVIPGNGWEYTKSINAMKENPDWDAFQVGANFIDNYMAYYAGEGDRTKVGLSLVDTAGLPDLLATINDFAIVVEQESVELLSALGTARNNSQAFGTSLGDRASAYSYIDLRDFMTWFSLQTTITADAYDAAQAVIAAYDNTVAYSLADSKLPGANGLAIYLPATPPDYEAYGEEYPVLAPDGFAFWQNYLNQFYSTIVTELDGSALQLEIKDVFTLGAAGSSVDNPVIFFDAAGKGVVDLSYTVTYVEDDGTRTIVDGAPISYTAILPTGETVIEYPNELTPSTFTWGVEFPYVSDGNNQVLSFVQSTTAGGNEAIVQGTYVNAEGSQPAYLIFDTGTLEYLGMLAVADDAPYEASPFPGDAFVVDLLSITPEGEVSISQLSDTPLIFGVEPFKLTYSPAVSGTYEVGLSIADLAGNLLYEKAEIIIDNEGVDGTVRGYTDTNEGVYFVYPYAWGELYTLVNEDDSVTNAVSDNAGEQAIYVDTYWDTDAETALDMAMSQFDGEFGEVTSVTLAGLPAYSVSFVFETDEGLAYATSYSVDNEFSGSAVIFTIQLNSDDAQSSTALAELLDQTVRFFAPILD